MRRLLIGVLLCASVLWPNKVYADSTGVEFGGSVGVSYDVYSMNSTGQTNVAARRPASVLRLTADPTFRVGNWLELPITMSFTFREASVIQPIIPTPDISSFLQNPLNRLTIAPRIGWATIYLGTVNPRYSTFTVNNAQVFGVGFELKPDEFSLSGTYGILNRPVQVDITGARAGSFARYITALRLGRESGENSRLGFTLSHMSDDRSSIPFITETVSVPVPIVDSNGVFVKDSLYSYTTRDSLLPLLQEGYSFAFDMRTAIGDVGYIGGEFATTAFTRDVEAPELSDPIPLIDLFMTTRTSTRVDFAGMLEGGFSTENFGLRGEVSFIGPGYVSLTQPFLQQDRIDVTVSPRARLFGGALNANATVGWRMNDVINYLAAGSTQLLLNVSATGTLSNAFSITGNFSNFGYRTTRAVDTLRYEQVSTSFSIMPMFTLRSTDLIHSISASAGMDSFSDITFASQPASSNTTTNAMASYSIMPRRGDWSARVTGSFVDNDLAFANTTTQSITLAGRYRLLSGTVVPDVSVTFASNTVNGLPPEQQLSVRAGLVATLMKSLQATARLQFTNVDAEGAPSGRAYSETLGSFGLRYSF